MAPLSGLRGGAVEGPLPRRRPFAGEPGRDASGAGGTGFCHHCDARTPHDVSLEIVTESHDPDTDGARFSREPYRVTECRRSGATNRTRMNND